MYALLSSTLLIALTLSVELAAISGALVDRFPYVVVFTSDDDVPSIYGLRHAASDRADWFRRTMTSPSG